MSLEHAHPFLSETKETAPGVNPDRPRCGQQKPRIENKKCVAGKMNSAHRFFDPPDTFLFFGFSFFHD